MTTRRSFLSLLAALPFVRRAKAAPVAADTPIIVTAYKGEYATHVALRDAVGRLDWIKLVPGQVLPLPQPGTIEQVVAVWPSSIPPCVDTVSAVPVRLDSQNPESCPDAGRQPGRSD